VAVDHFMGYQAGMPEGLRDIPAALAAIVKGKPDAITMQIGIAKSAWKKFAGAVPLILQSSMLRFDDSAMTQAATPEDAVRMGADAFDVCCFVRGPTEWRYMQAVAENVRAAEHFEMPVICHVYPRN
jgi:class I fructose-bisphosphate aldolase